VPPELMSIGLGAELRFHRQKFELAMDWPTGIDEDGQLAAMRQFTEGYAARYGRGALVSGAPVEIVAMRAIGTGRTVRARLDRRPAQAQGAPKASGTRRIHQGPRDAPVEAAVVRGPDIRPGHTLTGPAIVDAADTTIWIPAGTTAHIDEFGTFDLEIR